MLIHEEQFNAFKSIKDKLFLKKSHQRLTFLREMLSTLKFSQKKNHQPCTPLK